jgi:hypothetical protein
VKRDEQLVGDVEMVNKSESGFIAGVSMNKLGIDVNILIQRAITPWYFESVSARVNF